MTTPATWVLILAARAAWPADRADRADRAAWRFAEVGAFADDVIDGASIDARTTKENSVREDRRRCCTQKGWHEE